MGGRNWPSSFALAICLYNSLYYRTRRDKVEVYMYVSDDKNYKVAEFQK